MKLLQIVFTVILSVFAVRGLDSLRSQPVSTTKETRLDQIKNTGVLRCGYLLWPRALEKDPNTGKMSGIVYELVEEIGKQLNVKIDWSTEAVAGQVFSDLNLNRYDMACSMFFATPARAREGDFTAPVLYWPVHLYARADDNRFDGDYTKANDASVKFSTLDGDISSIDATKFFPKANKIDLPQNAMAADLFMNVAAKKADIVISEPVGYTDFLKGNPGTLKQISGPPLEVMATAMALPAKEQDLKNAIDTTIAYLQGNGFIPALLKKHETPTIKFLLAAKPYVDD